MIWAKVDKEWTEFACGSQNSAAPAAGNTAKTGFFRGMVSKLCFG